MFLEMGEYVKSLLIVCPLVFLAGFVDAIAGGGGLISLPAYLFAGVPSHMAIGTNKFAMSIGTATASANYIKAKKVNFSIAIWSMLGALAGASIGSNIALLIPDKVLTMMMVAALPVVAVFILTRKELRSDDIQLKEMGKVRFTITCIAIGLFIGMYDGMIGPGTGTFMILAFTSLIGLDMVTSSGCAKLSNLASNVASLFVFLFNGQINFALAIPAAICTTLGAVFGSKLAIKGGSKYIKVTIFLVLTMLFVKFGYELFVK